MGEGKMKAPKLTLTLADLPDVLIGEILGRLPVKEAGKTSVLSRWWRHRWQSMLDLDLSGVSDPSVISQVLLHHGPLRLFKAETKLYACLPIIQCWLSFLSLLSSSTLRSLSLSTLNCDSTKPPPISLNFVASNFPNLTHLHLECCSFSLSPSSFKGFPNLRSLLIEADYTCSPHLSSLISTCPLLEELILSHLKFQDCENGLEIVAPKLRRLSIVAPGLYHLSISSLPLVESAVIDVSSEDGMVFGTFDPVSVLGGMTSVGNLNLSLVLLEIWARDQIDVNRCVPMRLPVILNHVRFLSLAVRFETQASLVPCMLRSCPSVEELEIRIDWFYDDLLHHIEEGFWEAEEPISMFDQLKTVKMTGMEDRKHELGFIRFLLARAIRLQTLTISFGPDIENKEKTKTKLLEYPRASSQAEIQEIGGENIRIKQTMMSGLNV